ncbi:CD59 glycoprotein-like isoform X2 [Myripristis murdjan]|uniref:CD59 glycoprotein-like isoform X1 n=1 Tax=Myripristis murdjan TaxID=586833 RepID=UPI001175EB1E|nr:CD59 glycoprotein-like isoform X1 [Myripristis murdjan]XP_029927513.1 CD59 glycoprotein-like isoform X2 [Myripristis murdjan]
MKSLLSLLLLSLLCSSVLSLECYVCSSSPTNDECNQNSQSCQLPLDMCMTTVDKIGNQKAIVKQCASRATCMGAASTSSVDSDGNGNTVNCCNSHDLCNFSGANTVHVHITLLALSLCGLLLMLY